MTAADRLITADRLAALPEDGMRRELIGGEVRMMSPAGGRHGRIAALVTTSLTNHVSRHQLGVVYTAKCGFLLSRNPDTVRAPDVAYVRRERAEPLKDFADYLAEKCASRAGSACAALGRFPSLRLRQASKPQPSR